MPSPRPSWHIPLVTTDEQVVAAIAQGIDPDGDEITCIRLVGVKSKWSLTP